MASVKLKLKTSQQLKDGSHPIILQVLKDNKKAISTLGLSCSFKDWNNSTNLPKNRRLSIICQKKLLEMEELLYEGIEKEWNAKKIVNIFSGKDTKKLMFFKYHSNIKFDKKEGISTLLGDRTKLNKFKRYLNEEDISFDEITFDLLSDYKKHLEENGITTIPSYMGAIRQVYRHAVENDHYVPKKDPLKKSLFSQRLKRTVNRSLDKNQIKELFKLDFSGERRAIYREVSVDLWRFCFLMRGLNMIELAVLKPNDIKGEYFEFTREKLKTRVSTKQRIKIYPEAREIINKYLDENNDYVFPILENGFDKDKNLKNYKSYLNKLVTLNYNLKIVGEYLNTDFNMTTMSARYSFINLAKRNEVPFLYLQELIGHKTNSTTDIYLDAFPQSKIDYYHREVIDLVLNDLEDKMIS